MSTLTPTPTTAPAATQAIDSFEISRSQIIVATPDIVWQALLDIIGPDCTLGGSAPMPFVLEAKPGGRWYRDLGDGKGHLWGHVQVIKPPIVLELCGPLFMSYAAISHVHYRLTPEGSTSTKLTFRHTAFGLIPADHKKGVNEGWDQELKSIKDRAEKNAGK